MTASRNHTKGFTLIELLLVMVIIGLLAALVGPRFFGQEKKARQRAAKGQIALFEAALDNYRLDVGRYPTTEQGLEALVTKPADPSITNWKAGGYLDRVIFDFHDLVGLSNSAREGPDDQFQLYFERNGLTLLHKGGDRRLSLFLAETAFGASQ